VGEIRKQISWASTGTSLHHYRTSAGSEVDIVLEDRKGALCGIEVKASASVGASDFTALKTLKEQFPDRFRVGVILYLGDQVLPFGDGLWLLPVESLWME
jgi:hypothetical protein